MRRIGLAALEHTTQRRWQSVGGATIEVGTAGEQWFAWHSRKGDAWVFQHERAMCDLADQWLARGQWAEVDEQGRPVQRPRARYSPPTTATH